MQSRWKNGEAGVLGFLQPEVREAVQRYGATPARIVIMTDERVLHADRDKHYRDGIALSHEQYKKLAENFADPDAVYWDSKAREPVYIFPDPDKEWCVMMPVHMPNNDKKSLKRHGKLDAVSTAYRVRRANLATRDRFLLITQREKTEEDTVIEQQIK